MCEYEEICNLFMQNDDKFSDSTANIKLNRLLLNLLGDLATVI